MDVEFTRLSEVNFGMFTDGNKKEVFAKNWKIEVTEDRKWAKSFRVTAHGVESWFTFSKYGLKQAIRFVKEKANEA